MHTDATPQSHLSTLPLGGGLPPILDAETIVNLRALDEGEEGFLTEIIGVFQAEAPGRVALARRAAEAHASRDLVPVVHALKGSARALGLMRLADLCQQIESAAHVGRVVDAAMLQRLDAEVAVALRALASIGSGPVA